MMHVGNAPKSLPSLTLGSDLALNDSVCIVMLYCIDFVSYLLESTKPSDLSHNNQKYFAHPCKGKVRHLLNHLVSEHLFFSFLKPPKSP